MKSGPFNTILNEKCDESKSPILDTSMIKMKAVHEVVGIMWSAMWSAIK